MRTARPLFVLYFVPCLLAVALSAAPAAAQGEVQFQTSEDMPLHPIFGVITDDPGPFNRIVWGSTLTTQLYLPPEEEDEVVAAGDPPVVQFNPVSGYPVAAWTTVENEHSGIQGHDVLFSHFTVGGWTAPRVLAEGAADPSLAIDPADGGVHLVYWTPGDGGSVWHRQAPADLTSWTQPLHVSDGRESAARPMALLHGKTLSIAYENHVNGLGSTPREIVLAQTSLDHEPSFSRTALATTYHAGRNWVRLDSDGRQLLVRWVHSEFEAGWTLREEHGAWGPVDLVPLTVIDPLPGPVATKRDGRVRPGR